MKTQRWNNIIVFILTVVSFVLSYSINLDVYLLNSNLEYGGI